jgi:hypothetical protein
MGMTSAPPPRTSLWNGGTEQQKAKAASGARTQRTSARESSTL